MTDEPTSTSTSQPNDGEPDSEKVKTMSPAEGVAVLMQHWQASCLNKRYVRPGTNGQPEAEDIIQAAQSLRIGRVCVRRVEDYVP